MFHSQNVWLKTLLSLEVTTKDLLQYLQQLIAISTVFFPRVVPQWNALPSVTVNAPTLQQFSTLVH